MRRSIIACGLLLALAGISSAVAATAATAGNGGEAPAAESGPTGASGTAAADAKSIKYWNGKAHRAQAATARWLTVIRGRPPRPFSPRSETSSPEAARDF